MSGKTLILLIAASQGILLALALIGASVKKRDSNLFLGLVLFVFAIELMNAWAQQIQYHSREGIFPFWILGSYLILPPSLWLFAKSNTDRNFFITKKYILFYTPAFIEIATEFATFYFVKFTGIHVYLQNYDLWFAFTEVLPIGLMIVALTGYWNQIRRSSEKKLLPRDYTIHFVKHYGFFSIFSLLTILWVLIAIFEFSVFTIIEGVLSGFLFVLGYVVYFQPSFFEPFPKGKSMEETFPNFNNEEQLKRLIALFEREKFYRKPRITTEDVAKQLKLPDRYVSMLINIHHNSNFNNFVNSYRVQEVLARISDPKEKHKTLLGIALESGFSSKSSFNQIFKTHTGHTPSAYVSKSETAPKS